MSVWMLETERLRLRRLTHEDRPALVGLEWLDTDRVLKRCLEGYARHGHALWAMIDKADGGFVGLCGPIVQEVEGETELEVGYHLLPAHRGRGLATEAARAVMRYAFEELGAGRVISIILPDNAASIAVARRNGLVREREARFRGLDVLIYAARSPTAAASDGERVPPPRRL
jgi:ribosomal-protein-alanine N-acetyltransferase